MARRSLNLAVVGATGAVGREIVSLLESRSIPIQRLELLASSASIGEELEFCGEALRVGTFGPESLKGIDVVIGAAPADVAEEIAPLAAAAGAVFIDSSSAFRADVSVPLVVPEVNLELLDDPRRHPIVASPISAAVPLAIVLNLLQRAAGLKRVVASAWLAASGEGQRGMERLSQEVLSLYRRGHLEAGEEEGDGEVLPDSPFPHQLAFNAIPQSGTFLPDGRTTAERSLIDESRRLLSASGLRMTATCVRVPWFACHALSVNLETERPISAEEARALLAAAPGVVVEDDPRRGVYPMPFPHAGADDVYVGRIRRDPSLEHGLDLWIVADNLRKGTALNVVLILEALIERGL
jgi:aspartate-semialdehyde dehydrogenase